MSSDLAIGRACRALRRRAGWRQLDLAQRAGVSQSLISTIERGHLKRCTVETLRGVLAELEADLTLTANWRAGELDRLLDEDHSQLVAAIVAMLRSHGWESWTEVTFSVYGERGSIDVLAWHAASRTLLVIEVKTTIASGEETARRLDVKVRLAARIARERFAVRAARIAKLLVVADSTTSRRRVGRLREMGVIGAATGDEVRGWLGDPTTALAAALFLRPGAAAPTGARRIRQPRSDAVAS